MPKLSSSEVASPTTVPPSTRSPGIGFDIGAPVLLAIFGPMHGSCCLRNLSFGSGDWWASKDNEIQPRIGTAICGALFPSDSQPHLDPRGTDLFNDYGLKRRFS